MFVIVPLPPTDIQLSLEFNNGTPSINASWQVSCNVYFVYNYYMKSTKSGLSYFINYFTSGLKFLMCRKHLLKKLQMVITT